MCAVDVAEGGRSEHLRVVFVQFSRRASHSLRSRARFFGSVSDTSVFALSKRGAPESCQRRTRRYYRGRLCHPENTPRASLRVLRESQWTHTT